MTTHEGERQLTRAGGSYHATDLALDKIEASTTAMRALPKVLYDLAPAPYIEAVLPHVAEIRQWLEWLEHLLIEEGTTDDQIAHRKLAELSHRPPTTVARWKANPLRDDPGAPFNKIGPRSTATSQEQGRDG